MTDIERYRMAGAISCLHLRPLLERYHERELSAALDAVVRAHLATCPGCQAGLDELVRLDRLVSAWGAAEPPQADGPDLARLATTLHEFAVRPASRPSRALLHIKVPSAVQVLRSGRVAVTSVRRGMRWTGKTVGWAAGTYQRMRYQAGRLSALMARPAAAPPVDNAAQPKSVSLLSRVIKARGVPALG